MTGAAGESIATLNFRLHSQVGPSQMASDQGIRRHVNQYDTRVLESSLSLTNVVNAPTRLNNTLDKLFLSSDILHLYSEPILLPPPLPV